jgi:hypothetical protein
MPLYTSFTQFANVLVQIANKMGAQKKYCDMMAEGRNHETTADSHCKIVGHITMVAHVHNSDVSYWLNPRLYSNRTVGVSMDMSCQQYGGC